MMAKVSIVLLLKNNSCLNNHLAFTVLSFNMNQGQIKTKNCNFTKYYFIL